MNPQNAQRSPESSPQNPNLPPGSAVPPTAVFKPGSVSSDNSSPVRQQPTLTQTVVSMEDSLPGDPAAGGKSAAYHPVNGYNSLNLKAPTRRPSKPILIGLAIAVVLIALGIFFYF